MSTVKQPLERKRKLVLVSLYNGWRLIGWRLAAATKDGNKYRVDHNATNPNYR